MEYLTNGVATHFTIQYACPERSRRGTVNGKRVAYRHGHCEKCAPEYFAKGGFDVVLGNPPWDMLQLDPQEFFAAHAPHIADAPNMAARNRLIENLKIENPLVYAAYQEAKQRVDGYQKFVHTSRRFPLTSYGRINLMALFADLTRHLLNPRGHSGVVLPTGIATDSFNQYFFADLVYKQSVRRLIG